MTANARGTWHGAALAAAALLLSLLATFSPALMGKVLGGHVLGKAPFPRSDTSPVQSQADIELQWLPFALHVSRDLRAGRVPLWSPWNGTGAPLLGNQLCAAFHPFTLAGLLVPWRSMLLLHAVLRVVLAFAGTWLLARRLRLPPAGAAVAAAGFATCGAVVSHGHSPLIGALAHTPLLLALGLGFGRSPGRNAALALGAACASSILAGHFEFLPIVWGLSFVSAVVAAAGGRRARVALAVLAVMGAAAALAGAMLLPSVEYLAQSPRFHGRAHAEPVLYGDPRALRATVDGATYRGARVRALEQGGWNTALLAYTFVGLSGVVLAAMGASRRGFRWLALATAGAALMICQQPLARLVWRLPPLVYMAPGKMALLVALGMSLLAGAAVAGAGSASPRSRGTAAALALAALLGERAWALAEVNPWARPSELFPPMTGLDELRGRLGDDRVVGMDDVLAPNLGAPYGLRDVRLYDAISVAGYHGILAAEGNAHLFDFRVAVPSPSSRQAGAAFVLVPDRRSVVVAADGASTPPLGGGTVVEQRFWAGPGSLVGLTLHVMEGFRGRVPLAIELADGATAEVLWRLRLPALVGALDLPMKEPVPVALGRQLALRISCPDAAADAGPRLKAAAWRGGPRLVAGGHATGLRLALQCRYAVGDGPEVVGRGPGFAVMRDAGALPRARLRSAPTERRGIRFLRDDPTVVELQVDVPRPDRLVLADVAFRGWTVAVDGAPAPLLAEGCWRAVDVPAGSHRVTFAYRPMSYRLGLFLSALSLLAVAGAVVSYPRSRT